VDIDQIIFLIAILNLVGDAVNILRFKRHIPSWIPKANILAIAMCIIFKLLLPAGYAGFASLGVVIIYIAAIKLSARGSSVPSARSSIRPDRLRAPLTKLLITTTIAVYLYQIYHGATDNAVMMVGVGAMFSPFIEQGEWWRFITAQFLHWGVAHLALNMLGLWFLGPRVEAAYGSFRFILGYLISGAGGMLIAWAAASYGPAPRVTILLGASASVLGLVGMRLALARRIYAESGSVAAKAEVSAMAQILVLQMIFDWMVPQVSSVAHLGGALCGWIIGVFYLRLAVKFRAS
jgi:membrane associated rhomboid family serine protease